MRKNLTRITGCFEQTVPRYFMEEFKPNFRMTKETCKIKTRKLKISGNKPFLTAKNVLRLRNSLVHVLTARGYASNTDIMVNRPRSIYQYSNMAPRLSGKNCKFLLVSFVSQFPKETWIQRKQHQI